ncbi:hypothetical protein SZ25_00378, partial [Candidatus Arcanobacter lacustris]
GFKADGVHVSFVQSIYSATTLDLEACERWSPNIETKCMEKIYNRALKRIEESRMNLEAVQNAKKELMQSYNNYFISARDFHDQNKHQAVEGESDLIKSMTIANIAVEESSRLVELAEVAEANRVAAIQAAARAAEAARVKEAAAAAKEKAEAEAAAIRIAKLKALRKASNEKAQNDIDDAVSVDQQESIHNEQVADPVTITGYTDGHHNSEYEL